VRGRIKRFLDRLFGKRRPGTLPGLGAGVGTRAAG
jgi:hypothetical protein